MMENSFIERYEHIPVAYYGTDQTAAEQEISIAPVHNHREFEIVLIRHGACEFTLNCRDFRAQEGDLILLNPYVIHSIRLPPGDSVGHDCICLDLSILDDPAMQGAIENGKLSVAGPVTRENPQYPVLRGVFTELLDDIKNRPPYWHYRARGHISILFADLLSLRLRDMPQPETDKNRFCREILEYLNEQYRNDISSYTAAAHFSYNQSYFCRTFKSLFGRSFSEYLNIFRLSMSKSLLLDTSLSITDIAAACGFKNPGYFAQVYKKEFGILPSHFRKENRGPRQKKDRI